MTYLELWFIPTSPAFPDPKQNLTNLSVVSELCISSAPIQKLTDDIVIVCFFEQKAITIQAPFYLRNLPICSGQSSVPLLSKGLSPLSFRFLEFLPWLFWPPEFNLTRMHFEEASGPSMVSVTRNLKFFLKKLCTAWNSKIWIFFVIH